MALAATAGLAGAAPIATTADHEVRVALSSQRSMRVRWEATVTEREPGKFVLQRLSADGTTVDVASLAARHHGVYEIVDPVRPEGGALYVLRYVTSRGRLKLIATREIQVEQLRERTGRTSTAGPSSHGSVEAQDPASVRPATDGASLADPDDSPDDLAAPPPSPPPRAA